MGNRTLFGGLSTRLAVASVACGACLVGGAALVACEDFNVLPPVTDSGPGFDSSTPPTEEAGPKADAGADADAGSETGPPQTYCDSVAPPVGSVHFLCADFDSPLIGKGWDDVTRKVGGMVDKTTDVAVSMPNALLATAKGVGSEGTLTWKRIGANRFTEATAIFSINPTILAGVALPSAGVLELLHITTTNGSITFGYSRGSTDFDVTGARYTGYYVSNAAFGGAAAIMRYKVPTALDPQVWTEVKLAWEASGKFNLSYNGINVLGIAGFSTMDTSVSFRLGAYADGDLGIMPQHRFDNVGFSIRR